MEQIKQEIINSIYENGENLITGPILQEVLLDMVDDVNSKVASASVAPEIVNKTGSWDDAADWIEENSSSLVHETDLDGYATEQWVEDQGYLKEIPEGYATTESLNELSESVAETIENLPQVDLSGYATTESVNEATESVKDWVEAKHYLTTASLSGSVTEETVGFMINDATASVKEWVESQSYATEQWVEEQGYLTEHQDISGLATTESVNQLSESIAQTIEDLPQVDLNGYVTTASYNADSASFDERINAITGSDLSGYATTESLNALSESVVALSESVDGYEIGNIWGAINALEDVEIIGWDDENEEWTAVPLPASVSAISESLVVVGNKLGEKANARDLTSLSESVASDVADLSASIAAITGSDLSGYVTTASYNQDSASFDERINAITGSDLSGYATTESLNQLSSSVAEELETKVDDEGVYNILAGTGLAEAEYGEWTVYEAAKEDDLREVSSSLSASIAAITGSSVDLSGYATTSSVNQLSSSVANDFANLNIPDVSGYATTSSVNALSASFDERILSASGLTYQDLNDLGLVYEYDDGWTAKYLPEDGEGSFDDEAPAIWHILRNKGLIGVEEDESGWVIRYDVGSPEWVDNTIAVFLQSIAGNDTLASYNEETGFWESPIVAEVEELSASVAEMVVPDLSIYATTESLNTVSASFDDRINNLSGSLEDPIWRRGQGTGSAILRTLNPEEEDPNNNNYNHRNRANASGSVVQGKLNVVYSGGAYSHAEGDGNEIFGPGSHAEGAANTVSNEAVASHVEGYMNVTSGSWSHAEGTENITRGRNSHAEGESTVANNKGSHTEGFLTRTDGLYAHAEGHHATASGQYSHAEGNSSVAEGISSHAEGDQTVALNSWEHAQGRYNATASGQIFSIGAGDTEARRKNAVSVITGSAPSASVFVYGIGGYDGTNPTPGTNDLASTLNRISGSSYTTETWTFVLEDSSSVTKNVVIA